MLPKVPKPRLLLYAALSSFLTMGAGAAPGVKPGSGEKSNSSAAADPAADKAWKELMDAMKPPAPPAELIGKNATPEQRTEFNKFLAAASKKAADKAHDFYSKYPDDSRAEEAREREKRMLQQIAYFEKQSA